MFLLYGTTLCYHGMNVNDPMGAVCGAYEANKIMNVGDCMGKVCDAYEENVVRKWKTFIKVSIRFKFLVNCFDISNKVSVV